MSRARHVGRGDAIICMPIPMRRPDHRIIRRRRDRCAVPPARDRPLFAPDFVGHAPGNTGTEGPEGVKQFVASWRAAMPDLHLSIDQQYAEGDMVGTVFTGTGTHTGPLMGIPPTGKSVTMSGMAIQHLADGKVVSDWGEFDMLGLLQQLGLAPSGPPPLDA